MTLAYFIIVIIFMRIILIGNIKILSKITPPNMAV
jgi:hypothetical protein